MKGREIINVNTQLLSCVLININFDYVALIYLASINVVYQFYQS